MFYAPWCGHCKRMKPEFEKAASILEENDPPVNLVKVDCTESGKDTCGKFGVSGYPTLKIFRGGETNLGVRITNLKFTWSNRIRKELPCALAKITTSPLLIKAKNAFSPLVFHRLVPTTCKDHTTFYWI